jgi:hypothetical protein
MPKDYELQIKVRNGYLLKLMRAAGMYIAADLARASGTTNADVGKCLNLKWSPLTKAGEWRPAVMRIAEALRCLPEDMFPPPISTSP